MKAYQVVENGKPLEKKEIETPVPTGKEKIGRASCRERV